ncbi:MAG: hypothetical protein IPM99_16880 [Rubrivivax sp.]|nr:hypothetical protein [Rubrivivax sp.]
MEPWPSVGFDLFERDPRGWLVPTAAWWRRQFDRPELALVAESCAAEHALHASLLAAPTRTVTEGELAALADADAQENYRVFLRFRDRVLQAGSIEAAYVGLFQGGEIDLPPLFVDLMAQAMLRSLLEASDDALQWRAAQMLFRPQRCTTIEGRLMAGDRETLDLLNRDDAAGELGRLLRQAGAVPRAVQLELLTADNGTAYFAQAERHRFLIDLTAEIGRDLGHGVALRLANARSGLKALAQVLERWVAHLLGVAVRIRPVGRIDDPDWRWHVGLDAVATALLNDLYHGREVDEARRRGIVGLFRLDFASAADMRPALAHAPVYLGAAADRDGLLRLKPQNLLTNLPLAARS